MVCLFKYNSYSTVNINSASNTVFGVVMCIDLNVINIMSYKYSLGTAEFKIFIGNNHYKLTFGCLLCTRLTCVRFVFNMFISSNAENILRLRIQTE